MTTTCRLYSDFVTRATCNVYNGDHCFCQAINLYSAPRHLHRTSAQYYRLDMQDIISLSQWSAGAFVMYAPSCGGQESLCCQQTDARV